MQLADIHDDIDPFRTLLTGYMSPHDLTYICSQLRNESLQRSVTPIGNTLLSEGFLGSVGKAAMLKSRAATLIPADLKKNPAVAKLMDATKSSETAVTDDSLAKWWPAMAAALAKHYGVSNNNEMMAGARRAVDAASEKLNAEAEESASETSSDREHSDALGSMSKGFAKKDAEKKLKDHFGIEDEPAPVDPKVDANKKAQKLQMLAPVLKTMGLNVTPEMDYDSVMEIVDAAGGGLKKLFKKAKKSAKKAKKLAKEDAVKLLDGVAAMMICEHPEMLAEKYGMETLKKLAGAVKGGAKAGAYPFLAAAKGLKHAGKAGAAAFDDLDSGGEKHKEFGKHALSGLMGLFNRQGRDDMGGKAMAAATKSFLAALAVAEMSKIAQAVAGKEKAGIAGTPPKKPEKLADTKYDIGGADFGDDVEETPAGHTKGKKKSIFDHDLPPEEAATKLDMPLGKSRAS